MKRIYIFSVVAFAAMMLVSCGKSMPKASLKNNIDTVSYGIGNVNARGLNEFIVGNGIDSIYRDEVIQGLIDGFSAAEDKKKTAYNFGLGLGLQIDQMFKGMSLQAFAGDTTQTLSRENFLAGFVSGAKGENNIVNEAELDRLFRALSQKSGEKNLKAGLDFLNQNKSKEGVKVTKSGLQYKVLKAGNGNIPSDTTQVRLHYEGRFIDGTVFDSSYKAHGGQPYVMQPRQFIEGFKEALTMMPAGSTWEVYIPSNLAYGDQQVRNIKPNSVLIFKIELLSIVSEEKK